MMIDERPLLCAVLYDREAWETINQYIESEAFTTTGGVLWGMISEYYTRDPRARKCDPAIILERVLEEYPKHKEQFEDFIKGFDPELGSRNVVKDVLALQRAAVGQTLSQAIAGGKSPDDISALLDEYVTINAAQGLYDAGGITVFDKPLGELIQYTEDDDNRIKLLPKELNKYLRGGVLPGHTIIIFGPVNIGKSTLAIHISAGFLRQGLRVLYIENEDLIEDTALKMGCRLTGQDRDWAMKYPEEFERIAIARSYSNFILPDPAPDSVQAIDRMAGLLEPDVIVVNQARNLTQGSANTVQQLDNIAKGLRQIAKRRRIVMVAVTASREMVDDKGRPIRKARLEMSDVYSSRTGFPAAGDVMIGISDDLTLESRGHVCLSLCKNKLGAYDGKTKAALIVTPDYARGIIRAG